MTGHADKRTGQCADLGGAVERQLLSLCARVDLEARTVMRLEIAGSDDERDTTERHSPVELRRAVAGSLAGVSLIPDDLLLDRAGNPARTDSHPKLRPGSERQVEVALFLTWRRVEDVGVDTKVRQLQCWTDREWSEPQLRLRRVRSAIGRLCPGRSSGGESEHQENDSGATECHGR